MTQVELIKEAEDDADQRGRMVYWSAATQSGVVFVPACTKGRAAELAAARLREDGLEPTSLTVV